MDGVVTKRGRPGPASHKWATKQRPSNADRLVLMYETVPAADRPGVNRAGAWRPEGPERASA